MVIQPQVRVAIGELVVVVARNLLPDDYALCL